MLFREFKQTAMLRAGNMEEAYLRSWITEISKLDNLLTSVIYHSFLT